MFLTLLTGCLCISGIVAPTTTPTPWPTGTTTVPTTTTTVLPTTTGLPHTHVDHTKPPHTTHAHMTHPHHTKPPHTTSEPNEKEVFQFVYEATTHQMVLVNNHNCYIFTLSDAERMAVHTDAGIRTLEMKLLGLLASGTQQLTAKTDLDHHLTRVCTNKAQNFYYVS